MSVDLGKYATTVLSAYAASLVLLALLVAVTFWRGRKIRARMTALDATKSKARSDAAH
ncbi:heme exporter protein CcmD [Arenibacterium halophilum]|uniref:Heme exporter protein D n=1 Tax=Arenibacterium halophilum TaxID=2583821 RepID=A0ABY2XAC5_9RHOB|nr:heme exporter protein CcmD [Arenibacterium halophilum]TMV13281.1 heme exporter protein CcmD [Arenibacterium halophilum]